MNLEQEILKQLTGAGILDIEKAKEIVEKLDITRQFTQRLKEEISYKDEDFTIDIVGIAIEQAIEKLMNTLDPKVRQVIDCYLHIYPNATATTITIDEDILKDETYKKLSDAQKMQIVCFLVNLNNHLEDFIETDIDDIIRKIESDVDRNIDTFLDNLDHI